MAAVIIGPQSALSRGDPDLARICPGAVRLLRNGAIVGVPAHPAGHGRRSKFPFRGTNGNCPLVWAPKGSRRAAFPGSQLAVCPGRGLGGRGALTHIRIPDGNSWGLALPKAPEVNAFSNLGSPTGVVMAIIYGFQPVIRVGGMLIAFSSRKKFQMGNACATKHRNKHRNKHRTTPCPIRRKP